MEDFKKIRSVLISVFHKTGLDEILKTFANLDIKIYSTGGTYDFIRNSGFQAIPVEDITTYPSIFGGRVKTLHPVVFGGILGRRDHVSDKKDFIQYNIPEIDCVVVDLYPFEKTVASTSDEPEIIEKIDIGGISLIRAAAKNFKDVLVVPSANQYSEFLALLKSRNGKTTIDERRRFAAYAFHVSSHYDTAIFNYYNQQAGLDVFKLSCTHSESLRYGENPHQKGVFYGNLSEVFVQLHGKAISYNNLNDLDAALNLIADFNETTFAILKHTNACGIASRKMLVDAWNDALAADPVSAFGGVLVTNSPVDTETAIEINKLFFEIIIAPGYTPEGLELLKSKKNRIILQLKPFEMPGKLYRTCMNGILAQDRDKATENAIDLKAVTNRKPTDDEISDLLFANKVVKHTKSNAIVLVKGKKLIASGTGQTSRVDALKQAIEKATSFHFDLNGAVMASDAFFPFADSVEIAHNAGIQCVIQPGGSVRDQETVDFCNHHNMAMVFTGIRHFKH